jgi:hypothetical protein
MEVWFWWQPAKEDAAIRIAYVTLVPAGKEDEQHIIWPPSAAHMDANVVLKQLYDGVGR